MSAAVLEAKMVLENSGFVEKMNRARETTARALETFKAAALGVTGLGAAFAAFRGVDAFAEGIKGAFEQGRQLAVLSRQTSQSVHDLVELRKAFTVAGLSADAVGTAVFMLQKSLGGVNEEGMPTSYAFSRIGLSLQQLKLMPAVQQFRAIIDGLHRIPDAATRSSVSMQIFGRSAKSIEGLLNDPKDFEEGIRASEQYANIMQKNAAAFEKVEQTLDSIRGKVKVFYAGLASGVAPGLQAVLDQLSKFDLGAIGERMGLVVSVLTQAFQDGKLGKLVGLELQLGATEAFQKIVALFLGAAQGLKQAVSSVFSKDFFDGIKSGFLGVAEAFGAALAEHLQGPINALLTTAHYEPNRLDQLHKMQTEAHEITQTRDAQKQQITLALAPGTTASDRERHLAAARTLGSSARTQTASLRSEYMDYQQDSLRKAIARHANDSITFGGLDAGQLAAKSAQDLSNAFSKLAPLVDNVKKSFLSGFALGNSPDNFLGKAVADLQSKTDKLVGDILGHLKPLAGSPASPDGQAPTMSAALPFKLPEGDRLAKMGLFIGGSPAAPGLSEARRTAAATERTSRGVDRLIGILATGKGPVAVYE